MATKALTESNFQETVKTGIAGGFLGAVVRALPRIRSGLREVVRVQPRRGVRQGQHRGSAWAGYRIPRSSDPDFDGISRWYFALPTSRRTTRERPAKAHRSDQGAGHDQGSRRGRREVRRGKRASPRARPRGPGVTCDQRAEIVPTCGSHVARRRGRDREPWEQVTQATGMIASRGLTPTAGWTDDFGPPPR